MAGQGSETGKGAATGQLSPGHLTLVVSVSVMCATRSCNINLRDIRPCRQSSGSVDLDLLNWRAYRHVQPRRHRNSLPGQASPRTGPARHGMGQQVRFWTDSFDPAPVPAISRWPGRRRTSSRLLGRSFSPKSICHLLRSEGIAGCRYLLSGLGHFKGQRNAVPPAEVDSLGAATTSQIVPQSRCKRHNDELWFRVRRQSGTAPDLDFTA